MNLAGLKGDLEIWCAVRVEAGEGHGEGKRDLSCCQTVQQTKGNLLHSFQKVN